MLFHFLFLQSKNRHLIMESFIMSTIPDWQSGSTLGSAPTWQKGWKQALVPPGRKGTSKMSSKPSEYVINENFNLLPFKNIDRSAYLYNQFIFKWDAEYKQTLTADTFVDKWENGAKRRRLNPEEPFSKIWHGGQQHGEKIQGFNLALAQWGLACWCAAYKDSDGNETNEIPPKIDLLKLFKVLGICITQPFSKDLQGQNGGPDVRSFTLSGEASIYQIFKGKQKNGVDMSLKPGTRLFFVLKPKPVQYPPGSKSVQFTYNVGGKGTNSNVVLDYFKPVVWTLEPYALDRGEVIDFVKEGIQIFNIHRAPNNASKEGEMMDHILNYRGHVWNVGRVKSYADPPKQTQLFISDDLNTNAEEVQRSRQMTVQANFLGPQSIPWW